MNDVLNQDDINSLLLGISGLEGEENQEDINDFFTSEDVKNEVNSIISISNETTFSNGRPKIDPLKTKNYRACGYEGLSFPRGFKYNGECIKLNLYLLSGIPFYVPVDVYKIILTKLKDGKNFLTVREVEEIEEYVKKEYGLEI